MVSFPHEEECTRPCWRLRRESNLAGEPYHWIGRKEPNGELPGKHDGQPGERLPANAAQSAKRTGRRLLAEISIHGGSENEEATPVHFGKDRTQQWTLIRPEEQPDPK
jgi:hypothetical protein